MARTNKLENIRNIGIVADLDADKITITKKILFYASLEHKISEIHYGSSTMDRMEQEKEKEKDITITSAATACTWADKHINIIDTPAHDDFTIEVERSMRILDGAVSVFCAVEGVQPQSEMVWKQRNRYGVPSLVFVNNMDSTGANFYAIERQIRERLKGNPIPIQLPIGAEDSFEGIVDLVKMKEVVWDADATMGSAYLEQDIRSELTDKAGEYREMLINAISTVDGNEDLVEKFLDGEEISDEEIKAAIKRATIGMHIVPMTCGTVFKNKGVQTLLDAVVDYMPAPIEVSQIKGTKMDDKTTEVVVESTDNGPFAALAFKIITDPFVGQLTFIRVYRGVLESGSYVLNSTKNKKERIGRIMKIHAINREVVNAIYAGEIGAVVGLKLTTTGDTLCSDKDKVVLESMNFPDPVISVVIKPKTKADQEKMGIAFGKLATEDTSFKVSTDEKSGHTVISGMGELHLEILIDRMKREFHVEAEIGAPQVKYNKTIKEGHLVILEPIMRVEIEVPEEFIGDVIGDVSKRRGQVHGMYDRSGNKIVNTFVPMSEMFGYSVDLRSMTQGRATYAIEFDHYEEVAADLATELIEEKTSISGSSEIDTSDIIISEATALKTKSRSGAHDDEDYNIITVFYGTDREKIIQNGIFSFNSKRADEVSYGSCIISIPTDHRLGKIERPSLLTLEFEDPEKHVVIINTKPLKKIDFFDTINSYLGITERKESLIFVHGYNVDFDSAARRTAQLAYDLEFKGIPMFYSWPSNATLTGYIHDQNNVDWAFPNLEEFILDVASKTNSSSIHLIAHSMGNRILTKALNNISEKITNKSAISIKQIILTAPDIDADIFQSIMLPIN